MMPPRHHPQAALRRGEAMTWGALPTPDHRQAEKKRMRLIAWKPLVKNSLRGFATVELPIGLKISDVPVLISNGKTWASLPSKPQLDRDGQHKRDVNGKATYSPILEWKDRDLSDRFSQAVVALVRAEHPDALVEESEP
jgi:hypothetical protein